MTFTYTIADSQPDAQQTVSADTRAAALKLVYETLTGWNYDHRDCSSAIADGFIKDAPDGSNVTNVLYLDREPEAFWMRCASLMLTDNQDFCEGECSPFIREDEA